MNRAKLKFRPQFKGEIEGWAVNYISRNVWKLGLEHEFDDLLQDAYFYFLKCTDRYSTVVEPKHFMSLFKTCLRNHFYELANQRTRRAEVHTEVEQQIELTDDIDELETRLLLDSAPTEITALLEALGINAGLEATKPQPHFRHANGTRETNNERLCRLVGVDPAEVDMVGKVLNWVHGERR